MAGILTPETRQALDLFRTHAVSLTERLIAAEAEVARLSALLAAEVDSDNSARDAGMYAAVLVRIAHLFKIPVDEHLDLHMLEYHPALIAAAETQDLGPFPTCSRCHGSGEADNPQFRCPCRWSTSELRKAQTVAAGKAQPFNQTWSDKHGRMVPDAAGEAQTWRPIEELDKDKPIIGALIRNGRVRRVSDMTHHKIVGWHTQNGDSVFQPTHGMPLPPAPSGDHPQETVNQDAKETR
jgi:hypothetical protein